MSVTTEITDYMGLRGFLTDEPIADVAIAWAVTDMGVRGFPMRLDTP